MEHLFADRHYERRFEPLDQFGDIPPELRRLAHRGGVAVSA